MGEIDPMQSLDGVAIVGLAGRFPGARNCEEFWQNLREGREGLTLFSEDELAAAGCAVGPHHAKRVRSRGVMRDSELFDAAFFGYSPKEAEIMDPQQRVFLEVAWTALESAGFDPDRVPGAVGVFAGASINTYYPTNVASRPDVLGPFGVFPAVVLNEKDFLATRVAYKLNLRGPALSVQTACSTSLVAVCNACSSLLSFECDLALAGGVAINFPNCHSHIHEDGGMISTDGHCRPFDKNSTGTLFSDGVGVVALRRLEDAVMAGDTILAVIKGFALNNDGSDKPGFTAPSVNGQARVVQMAQAFGDIRPDSISYIEAHGTATPLGDPIEIAALTQAFRAETAASQFCAIGSVKSNIGHLDVAAGIAGLIKTVLALQHRELPPTLHYTGPNPKIDFASTPFFVVDRLLEWKVPPGVPRRAGVSSFGIGGTNAHVVLEEAPTQSASAPSRPFTLLPISARSPAAVDTIAANLAQHLSEHPDLPLADVAYTLQVGRHEFNHRRVIVCQGREEALAQLGPERVQDHPALVPARHDPQVVFMFPGQGAQRVNMGRELYDTERLYRDIVDRCAQSLLPELGLDLRDVLFPQADRVSWAEDQIVQTRITQPALFVTEYALAMLWKSWGIQPAAMIGHSVGEYAAACLAGVFSVEDGLKLIAARGRLIQQQPGGSMLAVMAPEQEVGPLLGPGLSVASINAPGLCVVSGPHDAIAALEGTLSAAAKMSRRLQTSHAFHSAMMDPVLAPFTELVQGIALSRPQLPFVSNLTAKWITDAEATSADYWAQHLRQAVRFADGVAVVLERPDGVLLEVGPGSTLTTLARQHPSKSRSHVVVPSLPAGRDQPSDAAGMLGALGRLWQAGLRVDWSAFYRDEPRRRVPLPTYPFERKRFFVEPGRAQGVAAPVQGSGGPAMASGEPPRSAAVAPLSHRERIVARLHKTLQTLSGLSPEELGAGITFLEMGFDSVFLSQVSRALEVEFGVLITFRQIAEGLSSISRLADHLETVLHEEAGSGPTPSSAPSAEVPTSAFLPMTDAQQEVWLASQLGDDVSRTYNEAYLIRVSGPLRSDVLQESLQELVDRHDALRATFAADGSGQSIAGHMQVELARKSFVDLAESELVERQLAESVRAATTSLFDLATGPLFRFSLFELGEQRWAVLLVIHHLVADGWSWGVCLEEIGEIYSATTEGREVPDRPALQYRDYISWASSPAQQARATSAERYWLAALADRPGEIELPTDRPRPPIRPYAAGRARHVFDATLVPRLKEAAGNLNCTVFHLIAASFYAWLHRVTGQEDLVVAVPTAGQVAAGLRERSHGDRLVGHCVNMLPVRLQCAGAVSFRDFVQHAKVGLLDARDNQDVSFSNLINKLHWPRDPSRVPMASVSLNFGRAHQLRLAGLAAETQIPPRAYNYFDLTADVLDGNGTLAVDCRFNSALFEASTVARWLGQWETMLSAGITSPATAVSNQNILSADERRQLLIEWNATAREFPRGACLHGLAERQVLHVPGKIAVVCRETVLTYRELDQSANRIAHMLRASGVGRGQRVGLCVERSADMLAAVLGILKAGAAYVPLDPMFPQERLRYMAEDAQLALLVSSSALAGPFGLPRERQLLLDIDAAALAAQSDQRLAPDAALDARGEDPAYVIYTSGSTGTPKGVVVPHRAVVNFLASMAREPGLSGDDVLVAVTTLSFDIAVLELQLPLTVGGTVVIASRDEAVDGLALRALFKQHRASVMQATPVTWRLLLEAGWKGSKGFKALVGGEALPRDLADQLIACDVDLWNMYGPTETTVWSTCARITGTASGITIGTPIANTTVYILDAQENLCPIGVPGELCIGGDGVTLGYWNRPELTAERFIPDPFSTAPAATLYRTGDRARWRNDGTLEHLGRLDFQVKLRGYRIELGEIEAGIARHAAVKEVVVVMREDVPDGACLVAYLVVDNPPPDLIEQLRASLRAAMPEYMVPAYFVTLNALPLTPNAKIDRKALPAPAGQSIAATREHIAPRNDTERVIAEAWQELLGIETVSVTDNFFDLGGHSLLAVRLVAQMEKRLSCKVPLAALMSAPTVSALAKFVSQPQTRDSMVLIRPGGSKPPIFLVHDGLGDTLLYRTLAHRLRGDRAVYGLQPYAADGYPMLHTRVQEMAAYQISRIREAQPHGPYYVGGLCAGGVIAFEVARQLQQQGESIGMVALLDAANVNARVRIGRAVDKRLQKFANAFNNERSLPWLSFVAVSVMRAGKKISGFLTYEARHGYSVVRTRWQTWMLRQCIDRRLRLPRFLQRLTVDEILYFARRDYAHTDQFQGSVTLFRATLGTGGDADAPMIELFEDPLLGWEPHVSGTVQVVNIPGGHSSMLQEPNVAVLASQLQAALDSPLALSVNPAT